MASVDLFFERTPAAGPPWMLLFGDLLGEAPARTLELTGQFAELSFAGRASSIIACTVSVVFPEMTFACSALYLSKTQRPTVARVQAPWSKSAGAKEFGVTGQHTVANRQPLGTQDIWSVGDQSLLGVSAAQYSAVRHDTRTLSAFEVALHQGPEPSSLPFQSADPAVRQRILSAFAGGGQAGCIAGAGPLQCRPQSAILAGCSVERRRSLSIRGTEQSRAGFERQQGLATWPPGRMATQGRTHGGHRAHNTARAGPLLPARHPFAVRRGLGK